MPAGRCSGQLNAQDAFSPPSDVRRSPVSLSCPVPSSKLVFISVRTWRAMGASSCTSFSKWASLYKGTARSLPQRQRAVQSIEPRERLGQRVIGQRYSGRLIRRLRFGALAKPPSVRWTRDSQLLHLVSERRPLEAQAGCRSPSTSDNPISFAERAQNLLSLSLFQRIG